MATVMAHILDDVLDPECQVLGFLRVQPGRRLVEQQQAGFGTQRPSDLHHLAGTVGQAAHQLAAVALQVQEVDDLLHLLAESDLLATHRRQEQNVGKEIRAAMHMAADQQVVEHRFAVEQFGILERPGDAEFGHPMGRCAGHVRAGEGHAPGVGVVEAADDVEDGGLAGTVGADDAEHLAFQDRKRNIPHRMNPPETQRQVLGLEQRRHPSTPGDFALRNRGAAAARSRRGRCRSSATFLPPRSAHSCR